MSSLFHDVATHLTFTFSIWRISHLTNMVHYYQSYNPALIWAFGKKTNEKHNLSHSFTYADCINMFNKAQDTRKPTWSLSVGGWVDLLIQFPRNQNDTETCTHLFVHNVCAGLLAVFWSKAGSLLLRSQVRKGLESLILTATSGATFSVLLSSTLLLKAATLWLNETKQGWSYDYGISDCMVVCSY